ncbi:MAG: hypothetical protein R3E86_19335 [Pseudomonadales bacterium]
MTGPQVRGRAALALMLWVALIGCSEPQPGSGGTDGPAAVAATPTDASTGVVTPPVADGETLLAAPPADWQETGTLSSPVMRMVEYMPETQPDDAIDRVTFESQAGPELPDPIEFLRGLEQDLLNRCTRIEAVNIYSGTENGYPTSVRLLVCHSYKDLGQGEVLLVKAIQGYEYFYTITRSRRVPPIAEDDEPLPAEVMAQWSAYLRDVHLCDTRREGHACPG